jgi:hypothetical protein
MFVADLFKSRSRLEAENLFLRHQLAIALRRAPPRFRLRVATAEPEPRLEVHQDEGWRLHQPATLRQGGFHESGMWPFLRQT